MAAWNRLSYFNQNSGSFPIRRDLNGKGISQQLNSTGLDSSSGRRGSEQSRRISKHTTPYNITDGGFLSNRSTLDMDGHGLMSTHATESLLNNHGQKQEDGLLGPGRLRQLSAASYNFLSQKKDQFADGHVSMYQGQDPVSRGLIDMGLGVNGGLSSEVTGKNIRYVGQEEPNFAQASACESLHDYQYGGRKLFHESYLGTAPGYTGGEEDSLMPPMSPRVMPMSPRAMPMSPRKDELVLTMMSPRRDDINPTDLYGDIPRMMSPRRDDLSPTLKPVRRDFLNMGLKGTSRSGREEELLQHQDFPMSPRREACITPPMSPRVGWDYEAPSLNTPNLPLPVGSHPYSPPTSPSWRDGVKSHSQWDLLPRNVAVWNRNEREGRIEDNRAYKADIFTGVPQRQNGKYRAEMDNYREDYRGLGQGWSSSRWGLDDGLLVRPEEQDGLFRPQMVYGLGQMGRNFSGYSRDSHVTNGNQFSYNSRINRRIGMAPGYIRRDRNQQSVAGRVQSNTVDFSRKRYNGYAGNNKTLRTDRQEKVVKSTAVTSKTVKKNEKNDAGVSDKKSISLVAAIENASKRSNEEKTSDKPNGNKSSKVDSSVGATSTIENDSKTQPARITAPGISSRLSNMVNENGSSENQKNETRNTAAGDAEKKEAGTHEQVHQNGLPANPSKGSSQVKSQTETKLGEKREVRKRPSLVTEIEKAKRSRTLAEQRRRYRELEETYYDADELPFEIISKMNKSGARYPRAYNDDPYLRRRQQEGQKRLHCLLCGKLRSLVRPNQGQVGQVRSQRFCTCQY
ncbi:hypothetical protein R1sor_018402 [Riccia sorocarpa]|uniref:Uncharacterized protein n=1 Tax=Riccia sorocarpa TaxID=122646 RepID=A0ABD3I9K8_9MARC